MSKDLALILGGWEYNPNEVTVRRILGMDGREKIQMRLDLGILQMETEGRPDGRTPHGYESLLEYYQARTNRYSERHGDTEGFELNNDECSDLRQEAMQYYYRYLSSFHLGDYQAVIRDTEHNLYLFDLIKDYAVDDSDRLSLEQFRPYVIMMNTRARACLLLDERDFDSALDMIDDGILRIEDFLREVDREELIENCREIIFLQEWSERIRNNRPLTTEERLRRELRLAVEAENYEKAAELRDQLNSMVVG